MKNLSFNIERGSGRGLPSPKHRSSYVQGEHTQQGRLTEKDTLAGSNSTQKKNEEMKPC